MKLCFVDPIGMKVLEEKGFVIDYPKIWVAESLPYLQIGLTVIKTAVTAGKLAGVSMSDLSEWIDSQLDEVREQS